MKELCNANCFLERTESWHTFMILSEFFSFQYEEHIRYDSSSTTIDVKVDQY